MGYYTDFTLKTKENSEDLKKVLRELDDISDYCFEIEEIHGGVFEKNAKWYDFEEELKEVSKKLPDITIQVHGNGEESGDIWWKYFKNGKVASKFIEIIDFPEIGDEEFR